MATPTKPPTRAQAKKAKRETARQAAIGRQRRQRLATSGGVAAVVLALALAIALGGGSASGSTDPADWDLPAMGVTAQAQDRVTLQGLRGKPTVVNFFASWCAACDAELPGFRTVSQELAEDINWVGIASQETGDPLLMPNRHAITGWALARDIGGAGGSGLSRALGARGMPLTAFYGADGTLLHTQLGALTEVQLRQAITQLFGVDAGL